MALAALLTTIWGTKLLHSLMEYLLLGDNLRACAACLLKAHWGSVAPSLLLPDRIRECAAKNLVDCCRMCFDPGAKNFERLAMRVSEKWLRTHFVHRKSSTGRDPTRAVPNAARVPGI